MRGEEAKAQAPTGSRPGRGRASSTLAGLLKSVADLLFPPRCVVCRARGDWLCSACRPQLSLFTPPVCSRCGLPLSDGSTCFACRGQRLPTDALRLGGYFEGPLRQAVHRLKFSGERYLADPLGDILATAWQQCPLPAGTLIAVPLHPKHEAERGYNQSVLLARRVGHLLDLEVSEGQLRRVRETPPQMGLSRAERLHNVEGAFAWVGETPCPQHIILVDDVTTTGATLAACAKALRKAGARRVSGLVLSHAR
ncbi:MAG: ComF family protein [Chloroflexota bacterium]